MKKSSTRRFWMWLVLLASGGTVFQGIGFTRNGLGGACQGRNFYENGILTSVDFCAVLDCRNGFFGGIVQPCGSPTSTTDDLLVDCSNLPTAGGAGSTTTPTQQQQTTTTP